MMSKKLLTL